MREKIQAKTNNGGVVNYDKCSFNSFGCSYNSAVNFPFY